MTGITPEIPDRDDVVAGLFSAAAVLAAIPGLPVGDGSDPLRAVVAGASDADSMAQVDRIAAALGVTPGYQPGSATRYGCSRDFGGGVYYRVTASLAPPLIPAQRALGNRGAA
jgi:hypothetical protein